MKPVFFLALITLGVAISCNNQDSQKKGPEQQKDPSSFSDESSSSVDTMKHSRLDRIISWEDFRADSLEFDKIRQSVPQIKNAKTVYIAFKIDSLIYYLETLKDKHHIDSVNVFLGKYIDSTHQRSRTEILSHHRNKLTVMFAGKGTNKNKDDKSDDKVPPYNVGNPYP